MLSITRFISSPLSFVWILRGYEKIDFLWQLGLMVIIFGSFLLPNILSLDDSLIARLLTFSFFSGAWYILCILMSRSFSYKDMPKRN